MVYVRLTEEADLLEISRDYMRASRELDVNFETVLTHLALILSPFKLSIIGETRSGGFMANMLVDNLLEEEKEFLGWSCSFEEIGENIIDIISEYARAKRTGYLRMDGVIDSIREPYKRYFVEIRPLRNNWSRQIIARMDNYMNTVYIEGSGEALKKIYDYLVNKTTPKRSPLFKMIWVDICRYGEKKASRTCKLLCSNCNIKGYVYSRKGRYGFTLIIPDTRPPRSLYNKGKMMIETCRCIKYELFLEKLYVCSYVKEAKQYLERAGITMFSG